MGRRAQKIKSLGERRDQDVFWMSLDEAKRAIADKYEFMVDRYERRYSENKYKKPA